MDDMATLQPTRMAQSGKVYSSYFRSEDVTALAITTNYGREKKEKKG